MVSLTCDELEGGRGLCSSSSLKFECEMRHGPPLPPQAPEWCQSRQPEEE